MHSDCVLPFILYFFSLPTATKIRHFWTQVLGNFQYVLHVIWQTIYLFYTICLPQLWDTSSDEMSLCFISKSHQNDACKMISSSVQVTCHNVSLCVELTEQKQGEYISFMAHWTKVSARFLGEIFPVNSA